MVLLLENQEKNGDLYTTYYVPEEEILKTISDEQILVYSVSVTYDRRDGSKTVYMNDDFLLDIFRENITDLKAIKSCISTKTIIVNSSNIESFYTQEDVYS